MRFRLLAALAVILAAAAPARAEWLRAETRHFNIYSNASADGIARTATRLERLDAAMRRILNLPDTPEAAANPITVYVLDDMADVQRLLGIRDVAGIYLGRASGAVAFTPRSGSGDGVMSAQTVLFHEYAHHFLLSNFRGALPAWFSEGYAEFVATAGIDDTEVTVGRAANHRAWGLLGERALSTEQLLAPPAAMTGTQREQLYGRGWLLTHYLFLDRGRYQKLRAYLHKLNAGVPPLHAAAESFGDLRGLGRSLDAYLRQSRLNAYIIPVASLPAPQVAVRPLTPGERALIGMRMVSTRGVDGKQAGPLYARAARAAAAHPADAVAQGWLAEIAYDAGDDAAAEAAADRALAVDPRSIQALLYKARVRLRRLSAAKSTDAKAWREARSWIIRANRVNNDGAAALMLYHDSFSAEGAKPTPAAVAGLHRALELAPQDQSLRFRSVRQHLDDGEVEKAKRALRPLAYDPHGGEDNPAAKLMAMLDAGQTGPAALAAMDKEAEERIEKAKRKGEAKDD